MPIYHLNGKSYNIPDNVVAQFEKDNPNATINYQANGKTYGIPASKREGFLSKYPDAVLEGEQQTKKASAPQPQEQTKVETQQPKQEPQQPQQQGGYKPSDLDKAAFGQTIRSAGRTASSSVEEYNQFTKNLKEYTRQQPTGRGVAKTSRINSETGKMEDVYLTGAGTEHSNEYEAKDVQKAWVGDERAQLRKKAEYAEDELKQALANRERLRYADSNDPKVRQAIEENEARIRSLESNPNRLRAAEMEIDEDLADIRRSEEENTQRRKEAEPTWWDSFRKNFATSMVTSMAPMNSGMEMSEVEHRMSRSGAFGEEQRDIAKERDVIMARRRLAEEAKSIINDIHLDKQMNGWGLARAGLKVAETALDPNTWDSGKADLETNFAIAEAIIRADSGQELTYNEKKLLDTWAKNTAMQSQFGEQLSGWTKAGMVTGESLPFMLEMALNPASGMGKAATERIAQYAAKKASLRFLEEGIKKFGKEEGEKWAKRKGAEYLREHMKSLMAKKFATRAVADVTGAGIMSSTSGNMRVVSDAMKRMTGDVDIQMGDNGDIYYKGIKADTKDNPTMAVLKSLGSTTIENWSEMAGEYMGFLNDFFGKAIGRAVVGKQGRKALDIVGNVEGVTLNKAQKFIYELAAGKGIGAFSNGLKQFADKTQWHGVLGEYLEEVIGNIANAATVGDMTFDTAKDTGVFNLEQNIDTFCGVALMGGFMSALHTGGFVAHRIKYDPERVSDANSKIFGDELWGDIKTMIDNSHLDPREMNDALTYLLRGDSGNQYSKEEKEAIMKYTQAVLEKDGAEMVDYQPRMYSSTVEESQGENGKKQWVVTSQDKYGTAIIQQAFDSEEEAQAYEGELKMMQQQKDYKDYLSMSTKLSYAESANVVDEFLAEEGYSYLNDDEAAAMMADINDPSTEIGKRFQKYKNDTVIWKAKSAQAEIARFEEENGWEPGTVKWLAEQDPMQLDKEGLEMFDEAMSLLENLAYPTNEVNIEHNQEKGAEAGKAVVEQVVSETESIDQENNAGKQLRDAYIEAGKALDALLERNEKMHDEYWNMFDSGLSPQEIISSLDTFSREEVQTVIDYYNAKARYDAFMNEAAKQIDLAAFRSRNRHTFKGTIDGEADLNNVHTITDGTNRYYLVSGNVTTDPATRRITGSTSGLIIGMDLDGSFVQLSEDDGFIVEPVTQTLDQFEEEERNKLQEQVTQVVDPTGSMMQPQPVPETANTGTGSTTPAPETQNEGTNETALSRIPKDEGGNPLYEQASPEDTYDAFVEQVGENTAKILVQKQIEKAKKNLERLNKKMEKGEFEGSTIQEQIASSQALQQEIDTEQGKINYWNTVLAVPNNRQLNAAAAAANPPATPPAGTNNPPTPPTGGEENVPDWSVDKASDARARGYRITNGHRVDRPQPIADKVEGNEVEVKFDKNEEPVKGFQVVVMDAGSLVPSHVNGQRNVLFFIDEAQPKDRTDVDSEASSNRIAERINPEEITGGVTAYTGSPVVNTRGEVIQGNNRTIGLQKMWGNAAYEESQKKYKQYLIDHAAEFGLDPAAIEQMQSPVLVRMVDVTDEEAIRLGQKTAANTESGGIERIDAMRTIQSMGDNIRVFMNLLFGQEIEGQTLMGMIAENGVNVLKWLNDGRNHPKYISDTQYQSCFDKKGNLTEEAKTDLRKIVEGLLFADAPDRLAEMFYNMPAKAQNAILATFWRDAQSPEAAKILKDIQESIEAFAVISGSSEQFRNAKDVNAARTAVKDLQKQTQLFGNTETVLEKFSNFALELAIRYKGDKQNAIRDYFNGYYDAVQGKGGTLFEPAATKTKAEAIKDIFGIDINAEENGEEGSNTLGSNNQDGEAGGSVGEGQPGVGKSVEGGEQPPVSGGGSTAGTLSEREQWIKNHPLTLEEINSSKAPEAQKILARQYLDLTNEYISTLAKAAYTRIYNMVMLANANKNAEEGGTIIKPKVEQPATPSRPRNEAPARPETPQQPETPTTPPSIGGEQGGTQNSAQAAAKAKMAAALAKLKKHGKKSDSNTDAYSIENLTPEQIDDMFEVVEAGAELGYTLLDGVQTKDEWIAQMREAIAEPLKDATGYNDTEVDELLNDMWNYPYAVEGEVKTVSEWAAEKGINVNENNNGTGESNGDNPSAELPGSTTVGGSTEAGVESGGNNEGQPESGGETVAGSNTGGSNTGTQGRGQTNGGGQRSGGTGSTRGKAGGTRQSGQPGNLFGEDNGNGTNDTPGIEQGGTAASVPEGGIVVPKTDGKPKKPLADITQEKSPYKPASIGGKFAIGSVIPSGIADSIANAFKRLKEKFFPKKGTTLDFVREELGYKTNEEMLSDFESGKTDGLAAEQVDAVALAIGKMKDGKSFIVGDMTGVGKGRTAAALIRWGLKHGKKVLFVTEKSGLFSDMHRDLTDIGCDYLPFVTNSDPDANITDADGNKVIPKPMLAAQKALWQSGSDKLPKDKKGRQYDFVMTTYSQVNGNEKGDKKKAEWLREYAKDAIVIMDESHNASGESNTGAYFKEVVENASGVTFLSATYAKRPDNMLLYAIKSSMSAINMPVQSFLEAIKEYGVAMQELMASALFGSGEMIRRERDMSDVKTTWTDPKEIYSEEEYEQCRKTSDKTMDLINDIIQFQRDYVNPIVADHEKDYDQQNKLAALIGGVQTHAGNTAYKSQVSNITNLMVYAMKAKKAAEMAIEQIKQGKKPVIAVSNTMGSYIDELEDDIPEAGFRPIFDKGVKFSLRYVIADYAPGDDGKYHKIKGSERVFDAEDELSDAGQRALDNLRQRIEDYMGDTDKVDLSLSPIDLVKQMIADAGYNCGEITGRSTQLVRKEGGGYTKTSIRQNKKEAARKFNGGSKDKPIPEDEQYQALILNVAGATGISLHSSKKFGNQQPRTMIILQPNADVNKEVQMRGRIDRTGQVHRGEYFYMSSPIPAEQKITMMLKQKLASLDAQSVGTKQVSSNKVKGQDMDNKYGDEVCYQYLLEHLNDVNAYLEDGLQWNRKTREWEGRPGLLYDVMKALQRMPCEMQEKVIAELTQRYADQIEYLNQNGINDLETTTMDLEAVTIDKATFVKGKDNESENEFAHDTAIERVEVNVLKKPMRSSDIKKKMKELDALDEDGLPKEGVLGQTDEKVKAMMEQKIADRQARYDEQEAKLEEKVRSEHPKKPEQSEEEYEAMIKGWPALVEMQNKHKADIAQYSADLQNQYNMVYRAGMYLKPGRPYLVPLTDDISDNGALMYGRFLGFQLKNGDPRQVQAVFAVKDSRAMITIPVVNKNKVIDKIIYERGDIDISELETDKNSYNGDLLPMEQRAKNWDEWWDKMIPKNTNRQVRFMITGNVLQACGSLGKYKGQIVTFTRKNKETGEITLERGMLLAENFDPENFRVRRPVEKKDVWDSYDEIKDERSGISCHREGSNMVVKFEKRKGEKLSEHPVQKDETLKQMAMNNEIRPSGKSAILCVIKEDNAEKALEHLYKEYGYTKEELFVMPDSTEKPDAIVRTNRPWKDIIDEFAEKYGRNQFSVEHRIKQMLKRYKMDVNNDDLKQQIREAVQLRQAYLRRDYANKESNRLAWQVLIEDQYIERYKDDKESRERHMRIKEAILEELEFRGFKGNAYHFEQGKITIDDVKNMFNQMNDLTTEEGRAKKALFDKVMEKVSKLPMEIFMNEKLENDTGGWAGGRIINYNWKYMNADYIADQAKADTILHELIHTVTAYADRCVENGLEHLLDQEMIDAINELHGIFEAIKNDPTFEHDGERAYGLTNVREMLSEAGSNSEFRADLKKTNLWQKIWMNVLKFFGIKQNVQGAKQVNALESVLLRLDYLIENFNQSAWETFYQGTNMGGYGYKKADMQRFDNSKPYEISKYRDFGPMSIFYKTKTANVMQNGKKVANIYKSDQGYQAETPNWSYATEWYSTEKEALDALAKYQEEQEKTKDSTEFNTSKQQKDDTIDRRVYDPMESINRAAEDWRRAEADRKADVADLDSYSAKQVYHERINRAETMFTESWQDDMVTFKAGQNAIAKDKDIPDSQNAYQAMNLSYGKTYVEQEQFENQYKKPLIETVNKILKKTGWRMGDVDRYLFTKHGFERNRELFVRDWLQLERVKAKDDQTQLDHLDGLESDYIMMKNENYQKLREGKITFKQYLDAIDTFIKGNMDKKYVPEEHDYSGFTEMFGDEDGDYDEADILAEMEQQEKEMGDSLRDQLWSQINDCSQYGLDRYRQSGMISEDTYKRISNMFHWYVPMRGFNEGMASQDHWQYMTAKDGAGRIGGLLKKAKGRKSQAGFPLATLFGMTNKAISDCNQNEVKQHLWRLVQAHPNDLVKVSDAWVVKDPTTGEWKTAYPIINSDMTPEEKERKLKEFNERMNRLEVKGEAKRLRSSLKYTKFDYKVDSQHRGEHIVEVMINGDRKYMIVTGNPRMAQAINGELRYQGGKGMVSRALNAMKQFMQSVSTSFNITFLGRNMARDWTHFGAILAVREGAGYEKAAQKYYWKQLPKMVSLFKKFREGKLDMRNEMERDFKDFMENGGITGFVNMQKVEAIQKEMENFIKKQKDGSLLKVNSKFYDLTLGAIEAMNEAIENNARFATYRASRHYAGRTKARSAYDAKEVTVNFNKKGAGRKTAGFKSDLGKKTTTIKTPFGSKTIEYNPVEASAKLWGETGQILAANKMFFNATVQAICTIFKNTQNKDGSLNWPYITKLASAYAAPPFILGFVMPYINQQLVALAGGDGDDDPYANLPEWTRRKNICLYLGWIPGCGKDDFLTIPIGQELAAFYSLGDMLAGKTYDKNLEPLDKDFADEMLGFLNVFSPVDFDTKITSEDHAAPISEYVGRVYSVAAPLVAIGENMSWNGRPIFRNDKYNGDEYIPEYKMAFNSTNQQFVAASKFLNDISGGDDVTRGAIQINPATMQYLVEQYTGGPGKLFANTLVSAGRDLKNFITNDEVDFNIRKIEGIRAFYQQGDDRTQFYRTQAKYRKYKEEADEFGYKLKAYEKDAATNPDHYMKLMELARGKELARYNIIKEVDKTLKEVNTAANQATGRDRKNIRALYNEQLKYIVDELDKVQDIE